MIQTPRMDQIQGPGSSWGWDKTIWPHPRSSDCFGERRLAWLRSSGRLPMCTGPVGIGLGQAQSHLRGQPLPCKARSFIPLTTSSPKPLLSQHPTARKGRLWFFLSGDPFSALISVLWAARATVVLSKPCCSSETAFCHHRVLDHTLKLTRISESDTQACVLLQNLPKSLRSSSRFETPPIYSGQLVASATKALKQVSADLTPHSQDAM